MKVLVHETEVRIDRKILSEEIEKARMAFDEIGNRDTKQGRSLFTVYNTMNKFEERLMPGQDIIKVKGQYDDQTTERVYYKPSVTSIAKPFRKCVIPLKEGNEFMFFDIVAAEFIMTALYANERPVIEAYMRGEDPYNALKHFFPEGTERKEYKTTLIAGLYGGTPYSTALRLGISENKAERLTHAAERALPQIERMKERIIHRAEMNGYYAYPTNLEQTEFKSMPFRALKDKTIGFNPNLALSTYTACSFGVWLQNLIHKVRHNKHGELRKNMGTVLTVFDSMLIEINPNHREQWKNYILSYIKPFRADIQYGKTFFDAAYKEKEQ